MAMAISVTISSITMSPAATTIIAIVVLVMVAIAIVLAIFWRVDVVVPVILYEVDRCAAGAILAAMFAPILRMTTRDMQIHRLTNNLNGLNDHGLAVNQGRP